ncbi:MAG: hypothetical protein QNJ94_06605 [Alphaproteobacteria bacterium]|nr:hypothetical protein [Alphaproteobacteria bacterium]
MQGLDGFDEDSTGTVFRDVIMLALLGFVAIVILLLPHLKPPTKTKEAVTTPGNVIVEVDWPNWLNADVDLWVEAPGDAPVGYSNKGGRFFNLLRDDLGHHSDVTNVNYEVSYTRGLPQGGYTVNLHLYENHTEFYPIQATVVVSVKDSTRGAVKQILKSKVNLQHRGQELTVFRFQLNDSGKLVPGSVHQLPRPLRSAKSNG